MLEKTLEKRLVEKTKKAGGMAIKWTSPNMAGVPDRLVFLPGGRVICVELKRPGEKPTPLQLKVHQRLRDLGADVRVIDSDQQIEELLS